MAHIPRCSTPLGVPPSSPQPSFHRPPSPPTPPVSHPSTLYSNHSSGSDHEPPKADLGETRHWKTSTHQPHSQRFSPLSILSGWSRRPHLQLSSALKISLSFSTLGSMPLFPQMTLSSGFPFEISSAVWTLLKGHTRKSARMLKNSFQILNCCCSTRYNKGLETSLALSPGSTMCFKSCVSFTGPFAALEHCPECREPCYNQQVLEESNGERKVPWKGVHSSRLVGSIPRWLRTCSTDGRRHRISLQTLGGTPHSSHSCQSSYVDKPIWKPSTTPLSTSMTLCQSHSAPCAS